MLLEFRATNYKSFKDELVFSMVPAKKQKDLEYSILHEKIGRKTYKGLCSAVIYGANASGKTNIIGAMDTFKSIVLRGHIRNSSEKNNYNVASAMLELIPNAASKEAAPVTFAVKFTTSDMLVEYSFSADLGAFLERDYSRKILTESLSINGTMVFSRSDKLEFGEFKVIGRHLNKALEKNLSGAQALANGSLNPEELFLMNGFKNIFSSDLVSIIGDWIQNSLIVVYRADTIGVYPNLNGVKKNTVIVEKTTNSAAKSFGINSNAIGYVLDKDRNQVQLASIFSHGEQQRILPAESFESLGTIRFINLFPLVAEALCIGGTLVVDEFDASIHPMALMNIINIFHNDEINIHHAQLIFNTHNPIFLNANLYRRDEIKFVERDDATHYSSHYSLSDFGTSGPSGIRKGEDYMKNYFVDRYGAIKDVDFSPIFESIIAQYNEE